MKYHPISVDGFNDLSDLIDYISELSNSQFEQFLSGVFCQFRIDTNKDLERGYIKLSSEFEQLLSSDARVFDEVNSDIFLLGKEFAKMRYDYIGFLLREVAERRSKVHSLIDSICNTMNKVLSISAKHMSHEFSRVPKKIF